MKLITSIATAIALLAPLTAQAEKPSKAAPTIVGIAAGNENFTTLVAAAKAAGLVETLSGEKLVMGCEPEDSISDVIASLPIASGGDVQPKDIAIIRFGVVFY